MDLTEILGSASTTPYTRTIHPLHPLVDYTNFEVKFFWEIWGQSVTIDRRLFSGDCLIEVGHV